MKNIHTPRTLAECEFTVGHVEANPTRELVIDVASAVLTIAACVLIGVLLAWRG